MRPFKLKYSVLGVFRFSKNAYVICFGLLILSLKSGAQVTPVAPLPGPWLVLNGTAQTTTNFGVGIGTNTPIGWEEIKYCGGDFYGFVITQDLCTMVAGTNDVINPSMDGVMEAIEGGGSGGSSPIPVPINFDLSPYSSFVNKPLVWARVQNGSLFTNSSGPYTSRFILTPFGRAGFNIENPRATLDVKSLGGYNQPVAIFGRQKPGTSNRTQHIHFVPLLAQSGYNGISQSNDQGLFFTDGMGISGSNIAGAFVIAPWSDNADNGGMRMESNGDVEFRGKLKATGIKVEARWWPDFVFESNYELMPLQEVEKYVQLNKHLPGVPSQKEVSENGIDLGVTNAILLQKVEELTLYLIEIQKQNINLQKRLEHLENQSK